MPVQKPVQELIIVPAPAPLRIKVMLAHPSKYSRVKRERITNIIIHATHGAEGPNKDFDEAYASAQPLKEGESGVSAHYFVDSNSATRSVPDLLTAWHAGRTANKCAIGVEICGRADQTRKEWTDTTSLATLQIAARLLIDLCKEHRIPAVYVDSEALRLGLKGISTHQQVAMAWKETTHWDPGPYFPLAELIAAVHRELPTVQA